MIWFHKILKLVLKTAIMPQKYMYWSLKKTIYLSWQLSWTFTYTLSLRTMTILLNMCKKFCNAKSIPFQILHYPSLSWHITPLQILRSFLFYFGQKDLIKVPILTFSSALVKICQISQVFFQTISRFSSKFAYLFSVMEDNSSVLLLRKQYILWPQGAN